MNLVDGNSKIMLHNLTTYIWLKNEPIKLLRYC